MQHDTIYYKTPLYFLGNKSGVQKFCLKRQNAFAGRSKCTFWTDVYENSGFENHELWNVFPDSLRGGPTKKCRQYVSLLNLMLWNIFPDSLRGVPPKKCRQYVSLLNLMLWNIFPDSLRGVPPKKGRQYVSLFNLMLWNIVPDSPRAFPTKKCRQYVSLLNSMLWNIFPDSPRAFPTQKCRQCVSLLDTGNCRNGIGVDVTKKCQNSIEEMKEKWSLFRGLQKWRFWTSHVL